jgi:hypothetical protein
LTSQIFANIYLNEFDRFVRNTIKPYGYARYGDDFILFLPNKPQAKIVQQQATTWLLDNLKLQVHSRNNVIVKASQGLHYLGHNIYPHSPLSVDRLMARKVNQNVTSRNISSYKAMALSRKQRERLPWLLVE